MRKLGGGAVTHYGPSAKARQGFQSPRCIAELRRGGAWPIALSPNPQAGGGWVDERAWALYAQPRITPVGWRPVPEPHVRVLAYPHTAPALGYAGHTQSAGAGAGGRWQRILRLAHVPVIAKRGQPCEKPRQLWRAWGYHAGRRRTRARAGVCRRLRKAASFALRGTCLYGPTPLRGLACMVRPPPPYPSPRASYRLRSPSAIRCLSTARLLAPTNAAAAMAIGANPAASRTVSSRAPR